MVLLGINIDHVATVRQARGEGFPDPIEAAKAAIRAGANGITAHLREDRRHIQDNDIFRLKRELNVPLNMEMAATDEMFRIAARIKPDWVCLVPEKRQELTTEGGLDVVRSQAKLKRGIRKLQSAGVKVSLFIDPSESMVVASKECGANAVEIHTGAYARYFRSQKSRVKSELIKIRRAAEKAASLGLLVNAGHGLDYENVGALKKVHRFNEFNIGFSIISQSIFSGMATAVQKMKGKLR